MNAYYCDEPRAVLDPWDDLPCAIVVAETREKARSLYEIHFAVTGVEYIEVRARKLAGGVEGLPRVIGGIDDLAHCLWAVVCAWKDAD